MIYWRIFSLVFASESDREIMFSNSQLEYYNGATIIEREVNSPDQKYFHWQIVPESDSPLEILWHQ